jgi:hypothetical protein
MDFPIARKISPVLLLGIVYTNTYQWQHNRAAVAFNLTFRYIVEVDSIIIDTLLIWSLYKYRQII